MAQDNNKLLNQLAEQSADLDDIIDREEVPHGVRFIKLQRYPEERNPAIWQAAFDALLAEFEVLAFEEWFSMTTEDFVAMDEHPLSQVYFQAMVAASKAQADVETIRIALDVADGHADANARLLKNIKKQERISAAKEGIGNARFRAAKERRNGGK